MCYPRSYDTGSKQCECYTDHELIIQCALKCTEGGVLLQYNLCMTFLKDSNMLSVSFCSYFDVQGHNISTESGFIILPKNTSELNDYMCGPLNRKGIMCSECIEGYGTSVTSTKIQMLRLHKCLVWSASSHISRSCSCHYLFPCSTSFSQT